MIDWWNMTVEPDVASDIADAIRNRRIGMGPAAEELERRLGEVLHTPHVVVTTSGSAALLLALMSCDVGPGDEVIAPARTFVATASAPLLLGASVRLVDVQPDRPLMDCELLEDAITERTKAILPVHRNGRAADVTRVRSLAAKHGLAVIEDAAQAMCSSNENGLLGVQADLGCFSLGLTKLVTTGHGGFVATPRRDLYERLRALRNHGAIDSDSWETRGLGCNFKFPDILALIGLQQLRQVDAAIGRLKAVYSFYEDVLRDLESIRLLEVDVASGELPLWVEALSPKRDRLLQLLAERSICAKPFSPSLSDLPYLRGQGPFPRSQRFARQGLTLPSGPALSDEQLEQVADALRAADRILR